MKVSAFAVALAAAAIGVSGCTPVVRELRHSGGYPGYLMDKRFFDASQSKELQLLRASIIVAMASRVGAEYVRDAEEAEAFLKYLQSASNEINFMAGHIYPIDNRTLCSDLVTTGCDAHTALFESDMPLLEERILRLVVAALPQRQAAEFLDAAKTGDILSAAWKALRLTFDSVEGARRGAAVQRSTLELRALLVKAQSRCFNGAGSEIATVNSAVDCLNIPLGTLAAPDEVAMPDKVPHPTYDALFGIIRTSCGLLPVSSVLSDDSDELRAAEIGDRREDCRNLKFAPKLRFGGLRGFQDD